jgi:hypothetical protein
LNQSECCNAEIKIPWVEINGKYFDAARNANIRIEEYINLWKMRKLFKHSVGQSCCPSSSATDLSSNPFSWVSEVSVEFRLSHISV